MKKAGLYSLILHGSQNTNQRIEWSILLRDSEENSSFGRILGIGGADNLPADGNVDGYDGITIHVRSSYLAAISKHLEAGTLAFAWNEENGSAVLFCGE